MENTKIPTAEEFLKDNLSNPTKGWSERKRLIEFAKLHVKAALEAAADEAEVNFNSDDFRYWFLNAYPDEKIQ